MVHFKRPSVGIGEKRGERQPAQNQRANRRSLILLSNGRGGRALGMEAEMDHQRQIQVAIQRQTKAPSPEIVELIQRLAERERQIDHEYLAHHRAILRQKHGAH